VKALLAATAADTCLTDVFSEGWPAPHRVLRSAALAAKATPDAVVGATLLGGSSVPIARFSPIVPSRTTTGDVAAMALYAGESVTHVTSVQPAAEIVAEIAAGAEQHLRSRAVNGG
jgi:hypothetical protein